MARGCYPLLLLLCLTSFWDFSSAGLYESILLGSECNTSSWTGVWMVKNGQLECFRCVKGERWNRDEKLCEKCSGGLTSCESNVFHGACSKAFCDDGGNATSTSQALPTPTQKPPTFTSHTVTNLTVNETTTVTGATTGIPTPHMSEGPNGTATGSEKGTDEQNKEDETNSRPEIPPVKGNSWLVIGSAVGGIALLLIIIATVIWFVGKKHRSDPSLTPKSDAPVEQPGVPESTDTLLPKYVDSVIET